MPIKNFSPQIKKELGQDSFKKDGLFERGKENDLQIQGFKKNIDKWIDILSYWRYYPDKFLDYIKPAEGSINLYFYQRVYLRIMVRYRKVFLTATRGTSKSYLQNLAFVILCVQYPGVKLFTCAHGKEQSAKISQQCLDDIWEHFPLLKNEVKIFNYTKDYTRLIFYNGSKYDVVQMTDAARGGRRHGGSVEEICSDKFDGDILNSVVIPLMANNRHAKCGEVDPHEVHKREAYITTASNQQSFGFQKLMETFNEMVDGKSAFVIGNSYQLPCLHNQLDIDFVENLKDTPSFNISDFMKEYESIWVGSSSDSLVTEEKLKKSRKVNCAEFEHCGDESIKYILSYDVSRSEGSENALSALIVLKLTPKNNGGYTKEVVNIFSMEGTHYLIQAKFLKHQVDKFKPILLVVDANSYGSAVVDNLVLDLDDGYPPYGVVNDDRYDKYRQPNCANIVYALKSQNKETKDSDMIAHIMSVFQKNDIGLLKYPNEGLKELKKKFKLKETDTEKDAELMIPYMLTDILCEEISNLRYKNAGHDSKEERISKRIQRDKYSALKYGLWIVYQKEMEEYEVTINHDYSVLKQALFNSNTAKKASSPFTNNYKGFNGNFRPFSGVR